MRNNIYRFNPIVDEYECFHLADFEPGDAIRVRRDGLLHRGEVVRVDNSERLVVYNTIEGKRQSANVEEIVSLEPPIKGWLR